MKICLGIDPGWKNFGMALSTWDEKTDEVQLVNSWVLCPAKYGDVASFVWNLRQILPDEIDYVSIERFIAYKGIDSAEFEIINRLIGALEFYFLEGRGENRPGLALYRAIDWKMGLVKALHIKEGFDNPSDKLDKKFSIAAAQAVVKKPIKISTDHQADAICLSLTPKYLKR